MTSAQAAQASRLRLQRISGTRERSVAVSLTHFRRGRMAMPRHQELPEQFGRYRILDKLGAGGMGAVYLAEDTKLGRKVALKVPHFKAGDGAAILDRFRREARLAASIDHPNFCQVHDVDEVDGIHFFTMPFVEGKPL